MRVRPLGGNRAGEVRIGRFLRNARVTPEEMFATARAHTAERVRGRQVVVPQDTTSLRDDGKDTGHYLHPAIALDAMDGALLGLVHAEFLRREGRQAIHRNKRAPAEKESRRWVTAMEKSAELVEAGATQVTMVGDCESDIYEVFATRPLGTEVLARCQHDRLLTNGDYLFASTDNQPELGRQTIALPSAPGRPAREAILALRSCTVRIKRPKRHLAAVTAKLPRGVDLRFVEAYEVDSPNGVMPIHWRLLTTHPVSTFAEAKQITGFYRERWSIEQLFRVLKTKGFDIEAVRIEDTEPFEKLAAAILIAAVQVQQMVRDRDGAAERPLREVFDPADQPALEAINSTLEGKTERQKNPHRPGSLAFATWVCARLGGWTGYYGKPGPVVILQGYLSLKAMLRGCRIGRVV